MWKVIFEQPLEGYFVQIKGAFKEKEGEEAKLSSHRAITASLLYFVSFRNTSMAVFSERIKRREIELPFFPCKPRDAFVRSTLLYLLERATIAKGHLSRMGLREKFLFFPPRHIQSWFAAFTFFFS